MLRMVGTLKITKMKTNPNIRRGQIINTKPKNQKVDVMVMVAKNVEEITMITAATAVATEGELNTK